MVHPSAIEGWEMIFEYYRDSSRQYVKEYRVYHRIYKRDVHYIASRDQADAIR